MTLPARDITPAYPPFRMKAQEAAYYCGMSLSAFYRAVAEGELPSGQKARGGRYWLRSALEAAMLGAGPTRAHDFTKPI